MLTFGDVASAVSEVELDESDVEDLYGHLEKNGIELVEDLDPAQKASAEAERADGKRGRKRQKAALDLKPDMTTRFPAALPQGHRQGQAADGGRGGRAREADRAR